MLRAEGRSISAGGRSRTAWLSHVRSAFVVPPGFSGLPGGRRWESDQSLATGPDLHPLINRLPKSDLRSQSQERDFVPKRTAGKEGLAGSKEWQEYAVGIA